MKRIISFFLACLLISGCCGTMASASYVDETGALDPGMIGTVPSTLIPIKEWSNGTFLGVKTVRIVFADVAFSRIEGTLSVVNQVGETVAEVDLSDDDLTLVRDTDVDMLYEVLIDNDGSITEGTEVIVYTGDVFWSEAYGDYYTLTLSDVVVYDENDEPINTEPFTGDFPAMIMGGLSAVMDTESIHDYEQGKSFTVTLNMEFISPYTGETLPIARADVSGEGLLVDKDEVTPDDNAVTVTLIDEGNDYIRFRCEDENGNGIDIESAFIFLIPVIPATGNNFDAENYAVRELVQLIMDAAGLDETQSVQLAEAIFTAQYFPCEVYYATEEDSGMLSLGIWHKGTDAKVMINEDGSFGWIEDYDGNILYPADQ